MDKSALLKTLKDKMEKDQSLPLGKNATRLVFGVGNPDSKVLFIGEGPGYWEDQKGEPFVGNAGKLLDRLLYSIKLERGQVYITNVVHHRPPENRDPFPEEILAYAKYLDEIIEIIKPKIIVTLGRFSMGKFIPGEKITAIHGKPRSVHFKGREISVIPMYHPAAALRSTQIMGQIKQDFLKIPDEILKAKSTVEAKQMELV
jgi:DNA polymerase